MLTESIVLNTYYPQYLQSNAYLLLCVWGYSLASTCCPPLQVSLRISLDSAWRERETEKRKRHKEGETDQKRKLCIPLRHSGVDSIRKQSEHITVTWNELIKKMNAYIHPSELPTHFIQWQTHHNDLVSWVTHIGILSLHVYNAIGSHYTVQNLIG